MVTMKIMKSKTIYKWCTRKVVFKKNPSLLKHIQEHFKGIPETEMPEMTGKDIIFYLFVVHDLNGDGYLDGHEIRCAYTDFHFKNNSPSLNEVTDMVDHVLEEDDLNGE